MEHVLFMRHGEHGCTLWIRRNRLGHTRCMINTPFTNTSPFYLHYSNADNSIEFLVTNCEHPPPPKKKKSALFDTSTHLWTKRIKKTTQAYTVTFDHDSQNFALFWNYVLNPQAVHPNSYFPPIPFTTKRFTYYPYSRVCERALKPHIHDSA